MGDDTTALSYWFNWRFFLCAIFIVASMIASAFLIWKFEAQKNLKNKRIETWKTSMKVVHPCWLLSYRVVSFSVLSLFLVTNILIDGGGIFLFYTQWTFSLVTVYFGFASLFSLYGCCHGSKEDGSTRVTSDAERGIYMALTVDRENASEILNSNEESLHTHMANMWGYVFLIIYQISAGSVILTDCVFWFVIYPFMTSDDYRLGFIDICFHSINAVLLFGDMFLNNLRFPFFRIAYFILWTGVYVTFQWIIHFCVSFWWPYPFLDLSSSYAPIWYLAVGLLHLPCYGAFALITRIKHSCLSTLFPETYQSTL